MRASNLKSLLFELDPASENDLCLLAWLVHRVPQPMHSALKHTLKKYIKRRLLADKSIAPLITGTLIRTFLQKRMGIHIRGKQLGELLRRLRHEAYCGQLKTLIQALRRTEHLVAKHTAIPSLQTKLQNNPTLGQVGEPDDA